jgi:CysZ protein
MPRDSSLSGSRVAASIDALPDLSPTAARGWRAFVEGFAAPRDGLRYMMQRKHLWPYGWWPVILNALITLVLLAVLFGAGYWFYSYLHPKFSLSWWGVALEVLVLLALIALALALTAIAWVLLQGALCGYFYEKLARRVEIELGLPPERMREVSLGYQIADAGLDTLRLVLVNGGLLIVGFIPVVGGPIAIVGSSYVTCFTLGEDYFDHPLGLRGYRRAEKLAFCRKHRAHTLGRWDWARPCSS